MKDKELQPLFIWQKLTGRLIYEAKERPRIKDWNGLYPETRAMFDAQAKLLNRQLSLCSKCGKQAPLIAGLLQCEQCVGFPKCFECKEKATERLTFTSGISEHYCAVHAAIFGKDMIEERELLPLKLFVGAQND